MSNSINPTKSSVGNSIASVVPQITGPFAPKVRNGTTFPKVAQTTQRFVGSSPSNNEEAIISSSRARVAQLNK